MEYMNGKVVVAVVAPPPSPPPPLSSCISQVLQEKISRVLSGWIALQMAVHNEWGGPDSINKSHQLASDIFSYLFHCKGNNNPILYHENASSTSSFLLFSFSFGLELKKIVSYFGIFYIYI